ncbi:hypothetical protein Rsub_01655 [Raphidocelis subcapitata]|uniref:Tyrosine-protein kinase ephrin type A/B receptor-like domain-containing protein n=1 Tax=Raphidocelis subcapitata TaxID=307507 RepID=A0A2V0NMM3_9CHLO|nr:hypothetical protein Rsub_01655 [Raphidocelis subcapitata]|eukprot:GBF88754.1 hypothetical protein Rsub_01655 [Raphidocelis subcapitata]
MWRGYALAAALLLAALCGAPARDIRLGLVPCDTIPFCPRLHHPCITAPAPTANMCLRLQALCSYRQDPGGGRTLICLRCGTNYHLEVDHFTCSYFPHCDEGYYWEAASQECAPCGYNSYCPASQGNVTMRMPCIAGTGTVGQYSKEPGDCMALAGRGWAAPAVVEGSVVACPRGTHNSQPFTRAPTSAVAGPPFGCRRCNNGLTTLAEGTAGAAGCVAPAGHYLSVGRATPCRMGYFKPRAGNVACDACPKGLTTAETGQTSVDACRVLRPGYGADANGTVYPCLPGTYSLGGATSKPPNPVPCEPCGEGLATQAAGATSEAACLAPPGWGYDAEHNRAVPCPPGSYNPGWNTAPCTPCGEGLITVGNSSTGPSACLVPAGWGADSNAGVWYAYPCPPDTFGQAVPLPPGDGVDCELCLEQTTTFGATGATSFAQCQTHPGYGFCKNKVCRCELGTWSAGHSQLPCTACLPGRTTLDDQSSSEADCVIKPGWTLNGSGSVVKCRVGTYKEVYGPDPCQPCPSGTTTTQPGGIGPPDCSVCRMGYGATGGGGAAALACGLCAPGSWSGGGGALACLSCGSDKVSRPGTSTPDDCLHTFVEPGSSTGEHFDYVPMSDDALTPSADAATAAACQLACRTAAGASDGCQYYEFRGAATAGAPRCYLRLRGIGVPGSFGDSDPEEKVIFLVRIRTYAAYAAHPSDWDGLGSELLGAETRFATFADAAAACDATGRCAGIKFSSLRGGALPWQLFSAALHDTIAGMLRLTGPELNPWVPPPPDS